MCERSTETLKALTRIVDIGVSNRDLKGKAYAAIAKARRVGTGPLLPTTCDACESEPEEAHHHDYSLPLEVMWLCVSCHRTVHSWIKYGMPDDGRYVRPERVLSPAMKAAEDSWNNAAAAAYALVGERSGKSLTQLAADMGYREYTLERFVKRQTRWSLDGVLRLATVSEQDLVEMLSPRGKGRATSNSGYAFNEECHVCGEQAITEICVTHGLPVCDNCDCRRKEHHA